MEMKHKDALESACADAIVNAEGSATDELQANRQQAMRYYKGGPRGDEIAGRSQIVSTDVADTTNATLAMLREMLILDADLVIEPESTQDEQLAQAQSDICSDVLFKDNDGELCLLAAIKDGLLLKNGCIKVRMEDDNVRVYSVPIENVSYTAGWAGRFQDVPFFAEAIQYSRSELREMGLSRSVVDALNATTDTYNPTSVARNVDGTQPITSPPQSEDRIDCYECYVLDSLGAEDGISKRWQCLMAGTDELLAYEEVPLIPYALGAPWLASHRLTGESIYDRVHQIQDSNTTMQRQWHDNIALINNGRYIYDPSRVTESDVLSPTAGGGIRAQDISAIAPLMVQDVTQGIANAMQYNNKKRTEAVGAALDMASAEAQVMQKSATAAAIDKGNSELVSSLIASNFALTLIKGTYQLIYFFLSNYSERTYPARVSGQSVQVDPSQWQPNRRMMVRSGLSPSVKAEQRSAMGQHLMQQSQAMQLGMGGILADATTLYKTQMAWLKMYGISEPEVYAIDPTSPQAQQAKQQQQQAAQAEQQAAMKLQEQAANMESVKVSEDARQFDADLEFKYWEANLKADVDEAKVASQGIIDLEKARVNDAGKAAALNGTATGAS